MAGWHRDANSNAVASTATCDREVHAYIVTNMPARSYFPPRPRGLKGRAAELARLAARVRSGDVARVALVGGGGSGKSMLAAALGHAVAPAFRGGIHWFRVGAWDPGTLYEMLARRLGVAADEDDRKGAVLRALAARERTLVVLDNHENDRALARFLESLRSAPTTWLITARRCLLSGVEVFPIVPPLVHSGRSAFPRVAALTATLRWNPLALDVADALVRTRAVTATALHDWLNDRGVDRVAVMEHEDDVIAVRLLVDWVWARLSGPARAMLAVLAFCEGDDVDAGSLATLARAGRHAGPAIAALRRWNLVQEPLAGRYTVHAVIRYMVKQRASFDDARYVHHYLRMLEQHPERVVLEQTHLFAAMDHAHRTSDLASALRIERLLAHLGDA